MDAKTLGWLADTVKEAIATATAPLNVQIETLTAQLQQLQNSQTPGYDDSAIKQAVQALRESIPSPYDDAPLRQQIEAVAKSVPAAYDDMALRQQIETVAKMASERPTPVDGRDALQLEILPAIDEQKSYTRGTYAKHAGGMWRAFEQTGGMRGWECIVNGVKSVDTCWEGKTLIETATLSDGTTHETRKSFAVQEYKGVFAHGEHEQGDTVTWAGSLWHCNVTGTKALPGDGSADWTLAVKKGRDGREVVKTERAQGPVKIGGSE